MLNKKTIYIFLLLIIIITTLVPLQVYGQNKDYIGHWAENYIQSWLDNNFVTGYPDGSFKPDESITRAEFVKMVNNLFRYTEAAAISFIDVNPNDWYYKEAQIAYKAGYIAGVSENQFAPNNYLTREQASVIVSKIMGLELNEENVLAFADNYLISEWAKKYVNAAASAKIILGYSEDNTFRPQKAITRAESVVLLDRLNQFEIGEIVVPEGTITPQPTGGGGDSGGGSGPIDPTPRTINIEVKNSIVMIGIEEIYILLDNLTLETPGVTLKYIITNIGEIIKDEEPSNGFIIGNNQGMVDVSIKATKEGYEDKTISFKIVVAPVKIIWKNDFNQERTLVGQEQTIKINIGLLESVNAVENVNLIMLWEKQVDSLWTTVDENDVSLTCESKEIDMTNGIYQLIRRMNVENETTISAYVTFNEVGEYKLTIYCIKEESI